MLDPYIIEEIRRREEERKEKENPPPTVELPKDPAQEKERDQNPKNDGQNEGRGKTVVDGDPDFGIVKTVRDEGNGRKPERPGEIVF